jgi:hypothetical protein
VHFGEIQKLSARPVTEVSPRVLSAHADGGKESAFLPARCPESPFAHYGQDFFEATASGFTHHISDVFQNGRFEASFPSHRRVPAQGGAESGALLKENFGLIQIKCDDPRDAYSCRTFVAVASVPCDPRGKSPILAVAEDDEKWPVPVIHASVEVKFGQKLLKREEYLPEGCPHDSMKPETYDVLAYHGPIARYVMFAKRNIPFLFDETRLRTFFIFSWMIGLTVVAVLALVVRLLCCRGAKKKKKTD